METKTSTSEMIGMIEQGVKDVMTSERFTEFLKFSAQFHHYSLNNVILILIQKPDASYVAGYNAWQKMNRQVTDEDGNDTVIATQYFRPVSVFDISQTSGEDIPTICDELFGDIENADELTQKISSATDYSISYEDTGEAFGRCNNDEKTIKVRDDLDDKQRIKTLIHEVAHSLLWNDDKEQHNSRSDQEIEAEATAYIVCSKLGIDTASYSFDYIASWSADKDVKALKRLLGNIQKASQKIIDKLSA